MQDHVEPIPVEQVKTVIEEETLPSSRILPERPDHAMVTVLTGPHAGAMFRIDGDRNVIGRAADATIRLQDEGLSWHHASIRRLAGSYYLEDLGSTNGTFLGQERVQHVHGLDRGVVMELGELVGGLQGFLGLDRESFEAHAREVASAVPQVAQRYAMM